MSTNTPTKVSAAKAYVGAAIAAIGAGLGALATALDDGVVNSQEATFIAIAVVTTLGGVFGGVYATTNKPLR